MNAGAVKIKRRKTIIPVIALLLTAATLFGCDGTPAITDAATTGGERTEAEETRAEPAPAINVSDYEGLVISKVYGNGGESDAPCEHSFIEIKNTGETELDLNGVALYCRSGKKAEYVSYDLPAFTLGAGKSYLIRGISSSEKTAKYDRKNEIIRVSDFDAEWRFAIDGKEIRLAIAPSGGKYDKETPPEELDGVISYFCATDSYAFDTGYVSDCSKNKVAVRTADKRDSGYYLQNLTKSTTEKLAQTVPVTSDGKTGEIIRSNLAEIKFSAPAGFYDKPLELELTAPEGYTRIFYTTDGSDPSSSQTRTEYKSAIKLKDTSEVSFGALYNRGLRYVRNIAAAADKMTGGHVIKACAFDGENYTGIYTNSYFVSPRMAEFGVTVMSVSLQSSQMFGHPGFYHNFNASSNDPNTRGEAFMEVFDKNGERRGYSNVELSISGHGSAGTGMRSMKVFYKGSENQTDGAETKLNFDLFDGYARNVKGQSITDFSRLLLRNSGNDCGNSYIRDAYMQRVTRTLDVETMAYAPVLVFINGDFWGIYNARERYSGDYVESHYGVDKDNVALIESDYSQVHTNQNAPFIVTSGLEDDADDFNELVDYIRDHDLNNAECYEYVCGKLDIDSFIDMYVSRTYFSSLDWPGNNIKVWRNRAENDPSGVDNKWHFTMLDMDMGISFYKNGPDTTEVSNCFGWIDQTGCVVGTIMHKLRKNEAFKTKFLARFYQVIKEIYVPSWMEAELDNIVGQRAPIEKLQSLRWGASMDAYNTSIADMRKFIRNRYDYVLRYLCEYFGVNENYLIGISGSYLTMSFSETRLDVTVNGEAATDPWLMKFDGDVTVEVRAEAKEGFKLTAIVFTDLNGKTKRYLNGSATITTDISGEIRFETKKVQQNADLSVRPGIVAGGCQMFYLSPEGKLYAWGSNNNNVLGAGAENVVTRPKLVYEGVSRVDICKSNNLESGNNNIAAAILTLDGDIYTIGAEVIPGIRTRSDGWTLVEFGGTPAEISVGYDHMLVLDKNGAVWGIGNNSYGQLGKENEGGAVTSFRKIADGAAAISAGRRNTAFIDKNGDCYVMGDARWNKFGDSVDNMTEPYKLLSGVCYITSGEHNLLMVTESGELYYAGWRSVQGFSQGTGSHGAQRIAVSGVVKASIMFGDIAILTESGAVYGYGINTGNCLGGTAVGGTPSLLVKSGAKDVGAGYAYIAYTDDDGKIRVNGSNTEGQAGNGKTTEFEDWSSVEI